MWGSGTPRPTPGHRPGRPSEEKVSAGARGLALGLRWRFRGNHERWRHHSVFTQLRGVSIPQGAAQLNCSTRAYAQACQAHAGAPAGNRLPTGATTPVPSPSAALSCPVSAVTASGSAAPAAAAPTPAGRPPAARRAAPAGRVPAATGVVAPVVPSGVAARGRRTPVSGPPAAARTGGAPAVEPAPAARSLAELVPAPRADDHSDEGDCDHRQDDEEEHDVTLLPVPPKRPPVGAPVGA